MKIVIIDTDLALGWYLRFDISGRDAYYNDYLKGLSDKQLDIHSKSEKVCGTAFSVKKIAEKCVNLGVIFGPFGVILGHFG